MKLLILERNVREMFEDEEETPRDTPELDSEESLHKEEIKEDKD